MPCNPPLNFVANGRAGSAFPPPLDPTPPTIPNTPTFTDTATTILDDLGTDGDGFDSAVSDATAVADAVDVLAAAADSQLGAILEELDSVVGQQGVNDAFDAFAGAQPGAEQLVGGVDAIAVPALGKVPIMSPSGSAVVNFGAPPAQGGVAAAGGAAYLLHYPVLPVLGAPNAIATSTLTGPNPPFVKLEGYEVVTDASGRRQVNALIEINPAGAGTFNAIIRAQLRIVMTGILFPVEVSVPVTVVVE